MGMVGGLDLHRRQITFDVVEVESGEEWRGRVWQPDRDRFRRWLRDDVTRRASGGSVALAVEGCTGWRYVVEEIAAAGSTRIWRSRPTPKRRVAASVARRPTAATRGFFGICWWRASCLRVGSLRRWCWSGANA